MTHNIDTQEVNWGLIKYSGTLPQKVYRYRSVKNDPQDLINFEILNEGIYLAGLNELNDPNEGRFILDFQGSREEIIRFWEEKLSNNYKNTITEKIRHEAIRRTDLVIQNNYKEHIEFSNYRNHIFSHLVRVACFTLNPINPVMWAHYSKFDSGEKQIASGGICIEYNCDESWRNANFHPIHYSNEVPIINVLDRTESSLVNAMYQKSLEWSHEDEWRIIATLNSTYPFPTNLTSNSKIQLAGSISAIIFGINTPKDTINNFKDKIRPVKPEIKIKQVQKNQLSQSLEINEL